MCQRVHPDMKICCINSHCLENLVIRKGISINEWLIIKFSHLFPHGTLICVPGTLVVVRKWDNRSTDAQYHCGMDFTVCVCVTISSWVHIVWGHWNHYGFLFHCINQFDDPTGHQIGPSVWLFYIFPFLFIWLFILFDKIIIRQVHKPWGVQCDSSLALTSLHWQ
jgi:hypothetical protein